MLLDFSLQLHPEGGLDFSSPITLPEIPYEKYFAIGRDAALLVVTSGLDADVAVHPMPTNSNSSTGGFPLPRSGSRVVPLPVYCVGNDEGQPNAGGRFSDVVSIKVIFYPEPTAGLAFLFVVRMGDLGGGMR